MTLDPFHPLVAAWFRENFAAPSECQARAWAAIAAGRHTLVAAPTGSGKTLAAFLHAIDGLVRQGLDGGLDNACRIVYVSPLKALSNDIQKNLQHPLEGINLRLLEAGRGDIALRSMVRTGDTPAPARAMMLKHPPHILATTPESLYILLTSEGGRRLLKTARTVIVDEIHAIVGSKRGAHLALSLERLERLTGGGLHRIGLSATQNPIEETANFLVGRRGGDTPEGDAEAAPQAPADCSIVDANYPRRLDLAIELPDSPLGAVLSGEQAKSIYDRLAELVAEHRSTLVFVNTRRLAERLTRALGERLGEERVAAHHGSLAREQRLATECKLKEGKLKVVTATSSLELGIDVGEIDLVCQIGTTGAIAALLQRVGRSGHFKGGVPKGRLFPATRDELVECLALLDAVRRRELDVLRVYPQPLDVLAQQIVALCACEDWTEDALFETVRRAWPYRALSRKTFDEVTEMLAAGFSTRRGARGAYLHRDGINGRLRARKGARLTALTCGGAIPDNAEYRVILEPSGEFIGTVDEDFAIDSMAGDIFQLGAASWRVLKLEAGILRVEDAKGQPPSIPFWFGEAAGRTHELSLAFSRLRAEIGERYLAEGLDATVAWLRQTLNVSECAAVQAVEYLAAARLALGVMPSFETVVFERFFDESGGMQFIVHAPFGSRLNRAWGLALRKRFCRGFNFELQAAATENALLLSLSASHSFPLLDVAKFLNSKTVRDLLIQALLAAPMFNVRWRWNAVCSLALKRFQGGKKTQPYLLRMQAEDLVACIFPDQLACLENIVGDREIPDHPLVYQTIEDCLTEAMDIERLEQVIRDIESGAIRVVACDLVEPSPLAAEIVNSRAYSFLDGAPLEERRTRAVTSRRWLAPEDAADLGRLDEAAIARVREEAWPQAGDLEELHDALNTAGFFLRPAETAAHWPALLERLAAQGRAAHLPTPGGELWFAAERWPQFRALYPGERADPDLRLPPVLDAQSWEAEAALTEILRARLGASGPVFAGDLAASMRLSSGQIELAMLSLETEGFVLRGRFSPRPAGGGEPTEWCERRLLARIHRYTLDRLRKEIEPTTAAEFMRFLFRWQRVSPDARGEGPDALAAVLGLLEGFEAAAGAWESDILPSRVRAYDPAWLDALCLSGKYVWARMSPTQARAPVKSSPIALLPRRRAAVWRVADAQDPAAELSGAARRVMDVLSSQGASFFDEIAEAADLLDTQAESALAELVARGLANADSFKGLRALLMPEEKKRRLRGVNPFGMEDAGRWQLLQTPTAHAAETQDLEYIAGVLLRRYGVIFRALLTRESAAPPWWELLKIYRRLEARGEIRGGRFVAGQYGEQFALPEAVESLRAVRKIPGENEVQAVAAADPLNLAGIVGPGQKLPVQLGARVLYKAGIPIAFLIGKDIRWLVEPESGQEWELKNRLIRRDMPPRLKAYL